MKMTALVITMITTTVAMTVVDMTRTIIAIIIMEMMTQTIIAITRTFDFMFVLSRTGS